MSCKETQTFMDGYLDGELYLVRNLELEQHLQECADCAALHQSRVALRAALRSPGLRYQASPKLRKSVQAALAQQDRGAWKWGRLWQIGAFAATAAALVVLAVFRPAPNSVEREAVESHVRSLMANHLLDVPSTDQHTVKPWFAGKLDFSPVVQDFSDGGFPLVGGRLDYLDGRAVAAVVYRRNQHVINVFSWPVAARDSGFRKSAQQGYNVLETVRGGMRYELVSDLNSAELQQLAELLVAR